LLKRKYWPDTQSFRKRQKKRLQIRKELSKLSNHPELLAEKKRIEERTAYEMKLAREECVQDIAQTSMTDQREQERFDRIIEDNCQSVTSQYKDLLERKRRQIRDRFKVTYTIKSIDRKGQIVVIKQNRPNLPDDVGKLLDELMDVSPSTLSTKKKTRWSERNKNDYLRKNLASQPGATLRSFCKGNIVNTERVRFGLSDSEIKADITEMCPPDSPFYKDLPTSFSGTRLGSLMRARICN